MLKREETSLPNIEFTTATGNFSTERKPITQIIIHSTVGSVQSAINHFGRIGSKVSAHYIIGNDGKLYQGLEEYYTAFHSGNWEVNLQSIGIECEWYQGLTPSDKLYETAAKLVADICKFYGLGVNRGVIKGHKEIVPTACPNAIDVDRIVREAQKLVAPKPTYEELEQKIKDLQATEERLKKEKDLIVKQYEEKIKTIQTQSAQELAKELKDCQKTAKDNASCQKALLDKTQEANQLKLNLEKQRSEYELMVVAKNKEIEDEKQKYEAVNKPLMKLIVDLLFRR